MIRVLFSKHVILTIFIRKSFVFAHACVLFSLFSSFAHFFVFSNEKYHITLYEISTITLPSEWPFSTFSCASFNLFNGYGHVGSIRGGDKSFS